MEFLKSVKNIGYIVFAFGTLARSTNQLAKWKTDVSEWGHCFTWRKNKDKQVNQKPIGLHAWIVINCNWMSNQFGKCDDMIHIRADLFRWSKAQHLNKHNKQSQWIWETFIKAETHGPQTELKVAKKFKRMPSIPIQGWLGKNDKIEIHQNQGFLRTRFGSLDLIFGSLEPAKIIIGSLESEKIGSLESEKSGPYGSIPGT